MDRRHFLKTSAALSATSALPTPLLRLASAGTPPIGFPPVQKRILIHLILDGGPDFRHMLPPAFNSNESSYGFQYWKNRATSHAIADSTEAFRDRWENDFDHREAGGVQFGFLNSCGWLRDMWDQGNVAIVNNVIGSRGRDHSLGLLVMEHGDRSSDANDFSKSGWGGRLTKAIGSDVNLASVTRKIRRFCYGPHPTNPRDHDNRQIMDMRSPRNFGLYQAEENNRADDQRSVMARALGSYYQARQGTLPADSPYQRILQHEAKFREFGNLIRTRLENVPIPPEIEALYKGNNTLNTIYFGQQIQNIYDCFACLDILNFRVMSMEYAGWDTHKHQKRFVEQRLNDAFGINRAFDVLFRCLPQNAIDNIVILVTGEFGRQLRANGDNGTDHGRGNSSLVIGKSVLGGIYGDMFPEEELDRINDRSPDINGKTEIDHLLAAVCDWTEPGTSNIVLPDRANAILEDGVNLQKMFAA